MQDDVKLILTGKFFEVVSILDTITMITMIEPDPEKAKEKIVILFKNVDRLFAQCYEIDTTKEYQSFINEYHAKTQLILKAIMKKGIGDHNA